MSALGRAQLCSAIVDLALQLVRLQLELLRVALERTPEPQVLEHRRQALGERAEEARPVRIRLAEALIERGRTIDGINLGWAILAEDQTWDRQLLRVTYPFPYEELVRREAAEWGVDPFMMAAIIRQESAFKADIVSHAGAIGLMQVMPGTGADIARQRGIEGFSSDQLWDPQMNIDFGAWYLSQQLTAFGRSDDPDWQRSVELAAAPIPFKWIMR